MLINTITPVKFPERLIYKNTVKDTYYMLSTKTLEPLGELKADVMLLRDKSYYRDIKTPTLSLYIKDLKAYIKRTGVGSDFIKFCKSLSRQEGAKGRVHVLAYNTDHPGKPPHKFYRKAGFAANNQDETKIIDSTIKNNTSIPADMCLGTPMYLEKFE